MPYLIKAIGIFYIALGILFIAQPLLIRKIIDFAKVGKRVYWGGVVRLVIGALLLIATPQALIPAIPGIIGALVIVSGILAFVLGFPRIFAMLDWFYALPENKMRFIPGFLVLLGILLIYSV